MKKLLLLLLVLTGMVSTANADNVTRRFVFEQQLNFWSEWQNDNAYIHIFYNNGTGNVGLTAWGQAMSFKGHYLKDNDYRRVFVYDLTVDEDIINNNNITVWFYNENRNGNDNVNADVNMVQWTGSYANDMIFYGYIESNKNKCATENIVYYLTAKDGKSILSTLDYSKKTGIATGKYTNSSSKEAIVAPNYALWDNNGGIRNTAYIFGPAANGDSYGINSFMVYSDNLNTTKFFNFTESCSYNLSFNILGQSFTITPYRTTTIGGAGYVTWSNDENYTIDDAIAYTVTDMGTYAKLNAQTAGTVFPGGTGLVLSGSGDVTISATNDTPATITGNNLVGSGNNGTSIAAGSYVLYWDGVDASSVGFSMTSAGTLAAHKAYLPASTLSRSFLSFNEEANGINEIPMAQDNEGIYNLQGIRMNKMQKGLNVVNGKKVMVK